MTCCSMIGNEIQIDIYDVVLYARKILADLQFTSFCL